MEFNIDFEVHKGEVYRLKGTIEKIKQKLTEYFERVKNIFDIIDF